MSQQSKVLQGIWGCAATLCLFGVAAAHADFGVVNLVARNGKEVVVQPGDEFSVVVPRGRAEGLYTLHLGDGGASVIAQAGERIPLRYDFAGEYTLVADLDGYDELVTNVKVVGSPSDQMFNAGPQTTAKPKTATITGSGVSVGSVYAGNGFFVLRIVGAAGTDFRLKVYGRGSVFDGTLESNETIVVVEGPDAGEAPWTLIKFINGQQKGGTHVLSSSTPYVLLIEDIKLKAGPDYVTEGELIKDDTVAVCVQDELTLEIVPNPLWALHEACEFLYIWCDNGHMDSGLEHDVSYDAKGSYDINLSVCSDPTGEDTTIAALGMNLIGKTKNSSGWQSVPDTDEVLPGVFLLNGKTEIVIEDPGANVGKYSLTWQNPGRNRRLQLIGPGGPSSEIIADCTGTWPKTYKAVRSGNWRAADTATVTLSHSLIDCEDAIRLVVTQSEFVPVVSGLSRIPNIPKNAILPVSLGGADVKNQVRLKLKVQAPNGSHTFALSSSDASKATVSPSTITIRARGGEGTGGPITVAGGSLSSSLSDDVTIAAVLQGGADIGTCTAKFVRYEFLPELMDEGGVSHNIDGGVENRSGSQQANFDGDIWVGRTEDATSFFHGLQNYGYECSSEPFIIYSQLLFADTCKGALSDAGGSSAILHPSLAAFQKLFIYARTSVDQKDFNKCLVGTEHAPRAGASLSQGDATDGITLYPYGTKTLNHHPNDSGIKRILSHTGVNLNPHKSTYAIWSPMRDSSGKGSEVLKGQTIGTGFNVVCRKASLTTMPVGAFKGKVSGRMRFSRSGGVSLRSRSAATGPDVEVVIGTTIGIPGVKIPLEYRARVLKSVRKNATAIASANMHVITPAGAQWVNIQSQQLSAPDPTAIPHASTASNDPRVYKLHTNGNKFREEFLSLSKEFDETAQTDPPIRVQLPDPLVFDIGRSDPTVLDVSFGSAAGANKEGDNCSSSVYWEFTALDITNRDKDYRIWEVE